jgi:hypothetical protein
MELFGVWLDFGEDNVDNVYSREYGYNYQVIISITKTLDTQVST